MKVKTRMLFLITGVLCGCLILVSVGPLFGYDNYWLMFGLCVVLVSIAFVLYIPARIELNRQYLKERLDRLPPEKLEQLKEKNPEFLKELEEMLREREQKEKNKPLEPQ